MKDTTSDEGNTEGTAGTEGTEGTEGTTRREALKGHVDVPETSGAVVPPSGKAMKGAGAAGHGKVPGRPGITLEEGGTTAGGAERGRYGTGLTPEPEEGVDTSARDTLARENPARENPARETSARENPLGEASVRDTPARETVGGERGRGRPGTPGEGTTARGAERGRPDAAPGEAGGALRAGGRSASGEGAGAHGRVGAQDSPLLRQDECDNFSLRLQHAVGGFVDAPRDAVTEADHVLEELAARFTEAVTHRRDTLRTSWQQAGEARATPTDASTEQLRLALRDYREMTERLLRF
ncbi:hypothetical protein [Streptomyces sp. NPDC058475]|uniref:hypothetical protein n=1 Tax=Streptomyces sp. NPDC058475 TaxID=3346518 RepID=UPI0036565237